MSDDMDSMRELDSLATEVRSLRARLAAAEADAQTYLDTGLRAAKECDTARSEAARLRESVRAIYYAAHWTPDRPCAADELWTNLRDAAGFKPGNAPKAALEER